MKRKIFCTIVIVLTVLINLLVFIKGNNIYPNSIKVEIQMEATDDTDIQFFYSDGVFDLEHVVTKQYSVTGGKQKLFFDVPTEYSAWRIDYGQPGEEVKILKMDIICGKYTKDVDLNAIVEEGNNDIENMEIVDGVCKLQVLGDDPYSVLDMGKISLKDFLNESSRQKTVVVKIAICIILDLFLLFFLKENDKIIDECNSLYEQRELVFNLAKNDFKTRYVGSYLGVIWAFIRPMVTIIVYWFVFQIGMKSGSVNGCPFVLWLIAGLVPWFYFSDALGSGTGSLIEYQYLVKKIVFNISTLPIVKIVSAFFVHAAFVCLTIVIFTFYGYTPDRYTFQIIYYSFCMAVFTLGLVYITSSLVVFFRDTTQIIGVVLEVGIWITPIMWQLTVLPESIRWIFKLNPLYYIVSGYRDSLITKISIVDNLYMTAYFWVVTCIMFIVGTNIFNKLKVHFADVL